MVISCNICAEKNSDIIWQYIALYLHNLCFAWMGNCLNLCSCAQFRNLVVINRSRDQDSIPEDWTRWIKNGSIIIGPTKLHDFQKRIYTTESITQIAPPPIQSSQSIFLYRVFFPFIVCSPTFSLSLFNFSPSPPT